MKKINKSLVFIWSLLVFMGCEQAEKIDNFPIEPSKLVLNGKLSDSNNFVILSKSLSSIDNADNKFIDNAEVSFYEDGEFLSVEYVSKGDGQYIFPITSFLSNKTYRVDVSHPDYQKITASTTFPKSFDFELLNQRIIDSATYDNGTPYLYIKKAKVSVKIIDTEKNGKIIIEPGIQLFLSNGVNTSYIDILSITAGERIGRTIFLDGQESINGTTTFDIEYSTYFYIANSFKIDSILLSFKAIKNSDELFQFEKTRAQFYESQFNPFADPVQIFSNVKGGFGVLGARVEKMTNIRIY